MRGKLIFLLVAGVAILFAQGVNAQARKKTGATITGTVLDSNGRPVSNASVTCETSSGSKPRAVHTDSKGRFFITGLKQESYDLRASRNGAYSDWERNIPLGKSQTKEVNLILLNGNTASVGKQTAREKQ